MKYILLINQFSSSRYLSSRFAEYSDIYVTALYTLDLSLFDSYLLPPPELFDEQIKFQSDDAQEIINYLKSRSFDYVINGFEASVELSDKLANYYSPQYANDPSTYLLRSDKYVMHKELFSHNISHIKQFIYNVKDRNLPNLEKYGINYPYFIKPLAGASSIGAKAINNLEEQQEYLAGAHAYYNNYQNETNKDLFLIAELIYGDEVLVDTFSVQGVHHIATIQKYSRNRTLSKPVTEYWEIVKDKQLFKLIEKYINDVLNITQFKNGFAHIELFLTPDQQVKLIEINPRVSGASGFHSKLSLFADGCDQISLLMKYIFNYETTSGDGMFYRCIVLNNLSGNPLYNLQLNLKKYGCVHEVLQLVQDGHVVKAKNEINLSDAAAFILLKADNLADIEQTTSAILLQDKQGWK